MMRVTDETTNEILQYYARGGEQVRLDNGQGRLEFLRTQELLRRYLPPPPASILDVGGGPGLYARWLANLGYLVTVVEPVPLHVEQAKELGEREGLAVTAHLGDARDLKFADHSYDAVLELGPLYHLIERYQRIRALQEAGRVVKPGGPIIVALISRFAPLLDGLRLGFIDRPGTMAAIIRDVQTGQHRNPTQHPGFFTTAYFHHPDDVTIEFQDAKIELEHLISIEGPGWLFHDLPERLGDAGRCERLLEAVRLVESEPQMLGVSAHLMAIGRSPDRRQ
jgi:SAM-dependent methyltransferase